MSDYSLAELSKLTDSCLKLKKENAELRKQAEKKISDLEIEVLALKQQIQSMRCCDNCKNQSSAYIGEPAFCTLREDLCDNCFDNNYKYWEQGK